MESLQNIKRRLRGVKNIGQITKAMELVAATKMRRSQEIALASRPYAFAALDFLANLSRLQEVKLPPLLEKRPAGKTCVVLVTSDKGLAGSFNGAVLRAFEKSYRIGKRPASAEASAGKQKTNAGDVFVTVGQKAALYLERRGFNVGRKFVRVGDYTTVEEVKPIAELLIAGYLEKEWDKVIVFSAHFRTALLQEPLRREILPVDFASIKKIAEEIVPESGRFAGTNQSQATDHQSSVIGHVSSVDYLIEPSPEAVLSDLARHLILMQMYHIILEANASEHAARRVAMKNATDNADGLASSLALEYNKSRQASITREIIEVASGAEALK